MLVLFLCCAYFALMLRLFEAPCAFPAPVHSPASPADSGAGAAVVIVGLVLVVVAVAFAEPMHLRAHV